MLVNGDLVKIRQGSVLMSSVSLSAPSHTNHPDYPLPLGSLCEPCFGIVIDNKTSWEGLIKILIGDEVLLVKERETRLVGG